MRQPLVCLLVGLVTAVNGFVPLSVQSQVRPNVASRTAPSFVTREKGGVLQLLPDVQQEEESTEKTTLFGRVWDRLDTLKAAGLKSETDEPQYQIGFRRGIILFCLAFGYKWYRARFINKIPVWDRQPQWNTVVTNKEQEKELKAYTCKTCGSTIFIARHRRWYFEGTFGLGGLGCYNCGAKGKDNFIMDRERIVEDVGDEDDYFDYERPLDFVSAAERRTLMKEVGGDEEAANQLLVDRAEESESGPAEELPSFVDAEVTEETESSEEAAVAEETAEEETTAETDTDDEPAQEIVAEEQETEETTTETVEVEPVAEKEPTPIEEKPSSTPVSDDDVFDLLDMD